MRDVGFEPALLAVRASGTRSGNARRLAFNSALLEAWRAKRTMCPDALRATRAFSSTRGVNSRAWRRYPNLR